MAQPESREEPGLNIKKVLAILRPNGALSCTLKGFEPREQQQRMMQDILEAYNHNHIALIEAGTGTGKSIAYLIPAILWAVQRKERTVISTNTIALQEQLLNKDIPLVARALNLDVKAVLVKGMNNYICLRKLEDAQLELRLLPPEEAEELEKIVMWKDHTCDGSRSDLSFVPTHTTWERVGAENDTCNSQQCPHYQQCHFFKARRQANDAQILIANHHLLFADLASRKEKDNYKNPAVLPVYTRLIIDEAHNIEDVATEYFAARITRIEIMRILARLAAEKHGKAQGKLPIIKEKLYEQYHNKMSKEIVSLQNRLTIDLPGIRRDLVQQTGDTFDSFVDFVHTLQTASMREPSQEEAAKVESKLRLLPSHQAHPDWSLSIIPRVKQLIDTMKRYILSLHSIDSDIKELKNERLNEQTKGIRFDICALAMRLTGATDTLESFIKTQASPSKVRWIEAHQMRSMTNIHLVDAELDVSKSLVDLLFSKFPTIVLCSATLTADKKFTFVRRRLGLMPELLKGRRITENIYDSPFDYQKQALFAIPTDIPLPSDPEFTAAAGEKIWQAIQVSRGNAFVLFTSYSMLRTCHQLLAKRLADNGYTAYKQGDESRQSLLAKFTATDRSILFGTDSFWEGVDVVGEALRCVIIVKLPFKVPSEPIIQARTEAILSGGGDPFFEYSLPNAIVKFKQGCGRLIRNKYDRGCIICLDIRLLKKGYGKYFLNSLPNCQQIFAEGDVLQQQMTEFYRKTYHLVALKKQGTHISNHL